jgi:hypothetical protein
VAKSDCYMLWRLGAADWTVKPGLGSSPNVTALLRDWSIGNRTALGQLLPVVYAELPHVATRQLRRERANHTLRPPHSSTKPTSG